MLRVRLSSCWRCTSPRTVRVLPVILFCGRGSQWPQRCPHCFFPVNPHRLGFPGESAPARFFPVIAHRHAAPSFASMAGGLWVCHRLAGTGCIPTRCVITLGQLSLGVLPPLQICLRGRFLGVGPQPFVASRSSAAPMGLSARPAVS